MQEMQKSIDNLLRKMSKQYIKLPKLNGQKVRKKYYISSAVRHPAKADIPLMVWILKKFCKNGEIVLDPMAGIFTTGVEGIRLFPNSLFIGIELEHKFVKWANASIKKTERIAREDWFMEIGKAVCVQGDARDLQRVMKKRVDKIVSSPPYSGVMNAKRHTDSGICARDPKMVKMRYADKIVTSPPFGGQVQHKTNYLGKQKRESGFEYSEDPENIGNLPQGKISKIISSPPYSETIRKGHEGPNVTAQRDRWAKLMEERDKLLNRNWGKNRHTEGRLKAIETMLSGYSGNPENIGNLKHGQISKIITSPPFGQAQSGGGIAKKGYTGPKHTPHDIGSRSYMPENTGENKNNISNLSYVDKVISSSPYEQSFGASRHGEKIRTRKSKIQNEKRLPTTYTKEQTENNVGNLKGETYLEAMLLIYQQCFKVLKPEGLMILITKDFIRNKKRIQLGKDTIKLCEMAGFKHFHTYYRKIENPSFWRILYQQKYPEVEQIDCEDILCFRKESEN